jgi:hypothetical protein
VPLRRVSRRGALDRAGRSATPTTTPRPVRSRPSSESPLAPESRPDEQPDPPAQREQPAHRWWARLTVSRTAPGGVASSNMTGRALPSRQGTRDAVAGPGFTARGVSGAEHWVAERPDGTEVSVVSLARPPTALPTVSEVLPSRTDIPVPGDGHADTVSGLASVQPSPRRGRSPRGPARRFRCAKRPTRCGGRGAGGAFALWPRGRASPGDIDASPLCASETHL